MRLALEASHDPLEPIQRGPAVSIEIYEQITACFPPSSLARFDQALVRLVNHAHPRHGAGDVAGAIRASVVDDENLVRHAGLCEK